MNGKLYHYVVEVFGGIEPELHGPLDTEDDREALAKDVHAKSDPDTDAVFWLDVATYEGRPPVVYIGTYSGGFFGEDVP